MRRRLRMYLWRQWQNGHKRFKELRRRPVCPVVWEGRRREASPYPDQ
jgi:hypothetical protein